MVGCFVIIISVLLMNSKLFFWCFVLGFLKDFYFVYCYSFVNLGFGCLINNLLDLF